MDIEKNNVLKYTFLIIPFKFEGAISEDAVTATGFYHPCDHSVIKYDRLYKHVADCIDEKNPDRTIFDFWADREHHLSDLFRNTLQFRVKNENGQFFSAEGYLKDLFVYCFDNGIGFLVFNFVFDEKTPLNTVCEILNKLKKIKRNDDSSKFEILCDKKPVDLFELIKTAAANLNLKCDLFFQHSAKNYVSATMLNSFAFEEPQSEETIRHALECLKRSQGNSFGTKESSSKEYLNPFKNMFWAFSTQGIANVNYLDPEVGNAEFMKRFYKNVKREYLLMTLLVLNQEYTLLDYCQKFVNSKDKLPTIQDLNRLYNFKIQGTFTTVSHLEHYRTFYDSYLHEMGIEQILNEVNTKQNAIYLTNKNRFAEEKARKDKNVNRFTKVLSLILSVFGITGLINNVRNLLAAPNALEVSAVVLSAVAVAVAAMMFFSESRERKLKREIEGTVEKTKNKNKQAESGNNSQQNATSSEGK